MSERLIENQIEVPSKPLRLRDIVSMESLQQQKLASSEKFGPENIILNNGIIENPKTIHVCSNLSQVLSLTSSETVFPQVTPLATHINTKLELLLNECSQKFPDDQFIYHVTSGARDNNRLSFGLMCLPCLNPNPFVTDHPGVAVNVATVIFLERLNNLASQITEILDVPVTFKIARELEHMTDIFSISTEEVSKGINEIDTLVREKNLKNIEVCKFPKGNSDLEVKDEDVQKFLPAFKRSQVITSAHPIAVMKWMGIINNSDATNAATRAGINLDEEMKQIQPFEENALSQARKWASVREFPWQTFGDMKNSIILSIRPGSTSFTLLPISKDSADVDRLGRKIPMLPQHCNVGIKPNKTLITMKRVQFLLQPQKWIEVTTEFGSIFVHRTLI